MPTAPSRSRLRNARRLIVNGDDFGFTRDVNAGIVEAHERGILTATTLMANGAAFEDAVRLAREHPELDIGCHLVLVQGESLLTGEAFPATPARLAMAVALGRIRIFDELAAQVRKIQAAGIEPTHLDTHKHTHLLPPVLNAVARIGQDFRIPWIRRTLLFNGHFNRVLRRYGCRATDHFSGFRMTGKFRAPELAALIRALPRGTTEFMCHPGMCGDELRSAPTRLKESRQHEMDALTAPEVREAARESQVEIVGYGV